jgi:hypothetical protein
MSGLSLLSGYCSDTSDEEFHAGDKVNAAHEMGLSTVNPTSPKNTNKDEGKSILVIDRKGLDGIYCTQSDSEQHRKKKQKTLSYTKALVPPQVKLSRSNVITEAPTK